MIKLGIIILNYKNWSDTINCLKSVLYTNSYDSFQVYLVDNYSQNESVKKLEEFIIESGVDFSITDPKSIVKNDNKITFLISDKNGGYAAGNNIGIRQALINENRFIFILNNDALVYENTITELIKPLKDNVILTCPLLENSDKSLSIGSARRRPLKYDSFFRQGIISYLFPRNKYIKNHYYNIQKIAQDNIPINIDIPSGSAMLFDKKYFEEAGLLDERTFLYLEEFIIHENIKDLGYKAILIPSARVLHIGGNSTKIVNQKKIQNARIDSLKVYLTNYRNVKPLAWFFIFVYFKLSNFIYNLIK